tara:strand:+ start:6704 stop:7609 length:906 start_codon:yes stop_codon:yes gene_type:complete
MNKNLSLETNKPKPIIKWAGGKSKIIDHFEKLYKISNYRRYIDLFCGSLSLPLYLTPNNAVFNDINIWLINLYKVIKKNPSELKKKLKKFNGNKYNNAEEFIKFRQKYNNYKEKEKLNNSERIEMAALFLYLNKRSFNGLYRENLEGKYNVPFRSYNSDIYNEEELDELSKYFNNANIKFKSKSYKNFKLKKFKQGDLVYIDPPYYPCNKSSFTSYWKTPFLIEEQKHLAKFCKKLDKRGVKFIVSNSPCVEIENLYSEFNMKKFYIGRQMRSAEGKSDVFEKKEEPNEILIWNFSEDIIV